MGETTEIKWNCRVCGQTIESLEGETWAGELLAHKHCYGLNELIIDELHYGAHGSFVEHMLRAWEAADPVNREMLEPTMRKLVEKYRFPSIALKGTIRSMKRMREGAVP